MRINLAKRSIPRIGELNRVVVICCTTEQPDEDVSTIVERPGVARVHARVRPIRGEEVMAWKGVFETAHTPTVEVVLRVPPDIHIDLGHWIFATGRYREQWLKVRSVEDMGGARRFYVLLCTIETMREIRTDPATQETPPVFERPRELAPSFVDDGF